MIFEKRIGSNALFGQHVNDISECIALVEKLIADI